VRGPLAGHRQQHAEAEARGDQRRAAIGNQPESVTDLVGSFSLLFFSLLFFSLLFFLRPTLADVVNCLGRVF
jgi:hypothetical protein